MPFAIALSEKARLLLGFTVEPSPDEETLSPVAGPVRTAVEEALQRGETHYTDRPGILALRQKLATLLHGRFGIDTDAKADLIITCGVTEARFIATQQVLRPGEEMAAPFSSELLKGVAVLRRATLRKEISSATRVVFLTSSLPKVVLRKELEAVSPSADIIFEVDESQSDFHPAQLGGFAGRTITLGGIGEAGWRIGYLASPNSLASELRDFKQALTICSTNLSQWAMLAALETH